MSKLEFIEWRVVEALTHGLKQQHVCLDENDARMLIDDIRRTRPGRKIELVRVETKGSVVQTWEADNIHPRAVTQP